MSSTQEVGDIFGQGAGSAQAMLRSPTVLILCVGLWGMNIFFYRLFGLDYKYILNYDLVEIEKEELEKERDRAIPKDSNSSTTFRTRRRIFDGLAETPISSRSFESLSDAEEANDLELIETTGVSSGKPSSRHAHLHPLPSFPKKSRSASSANPITTPPSIKKLKQSPRDGIRSSVVLPTAVELPPLEFGAVIVWYKLVLFSVVLLFLLHSSTHYWMDHLHRSSIGAVFFFYISVVVYIFTPLQQNAWLRRAFLIVTKRIWALVYPRCSCIFLAGTNHSPRRIPFVDVFFADAMCSLSKVFFDWGMLAKQAGYYPNPVPVAALNIVLPSLCAALPYLIRARQCLIMYTVGRLKRDPMRHQHLMNAFKYSTSMYPLILSAYLKTFSAQDDTKSLEVLLTFLLVINASYSLYWDIVMDWGMMQDPYKVVAVACAPHSSVMVEPQGDGIMRKNRDHSTCRSICLRPSLRYGLELSALIMVADSFLRFSWTLKFVPMLFPSHDSFVLCTQFLEVFRRAIWNLLRVEWENIKQQRHASASSLELSPLVDAQQLHRSASTSPSFETTEDGKESSLEMNVLR